MKFGLISLIAATAIGISAKAEAGTLYYLVGLRHVYTVPAYPDPNVNRRQEIEETYAIAIEEAQKVYDESAQQDQPAAQAACDEAVNQAAEAREASLGEIYAQVDIVRLSHPELNVDQDGPYQFMGVETGYREVFVNITYYRPYPRYIVVCPLGWQWGRPHRYSDFGVTVGKYHKTWENQGRPGFGKLPVRGRVVDIHVGSPNRSHGPGQIDPNPKKIDPFKKRTGDSEPKKVDPFKKHTGDSETKKVDPFKKHIDPAPKHVDPIRNPVHHTSTSTKTSSTTTEKKKKKGD